MLKNKKLRVLLCSCVFSCLLLTGTAAIADVSRIAAVQIEGTQRIEDATVLSHLKLQVGDEVSSQQIDDFLKTLYATGLFQDVDVSIDRNGVLLIRVAENPIINRIAFEGNSAIDTEDLVKETKLRPRMTYTVPKVEQDVDRILELYRKSGRFGASVVPKIVKLEQNRVDLVFEIIEGDKTGIQNINFIGNKVFSDSELREVVSSKESAWWRFLSTSDYYDQERINYDKELLRRFYLNSGFIDFRVDSSVVELTPDRRDFFVTFTMEEGERYKFGQISVSSELKGVDSSVFEKFILARQGDWYSADLVEKSVAKLGAVLGDMQYAFAGIVPDINRNKDERTVDLVFHIKEGQKVLVGRIDISGNVSTVDKVIRREMLLAENDPFSASALQKSEQNIRDLGFFSDVKVTTTDGDQLDRADIQVAVAEKATGEASIGGGYSSTDGPLGSVSLSQSNFMGSGQYARLGATISGRTQQFDFSFTEPYFMDRKLSAGFDVYARTTDNQDVSSYDVRSIGTELRTSYPLSSEIRQKIAYSLHQDKISNVPADASIYVKDQAGTSLTSSIGQSLFYDTRDSRLNPTLGYVYYLDTTVAGVGGDRKWFKTSLGGTQYYPLAEKWILSGSFEGAKIWSFNSGGTKINERFFLGGDNLRGFEYAGIGDRDVSSSYNDALGGDWYVKGTANLEMPTPLSSEFGIRAHLFSDIGILGSMDNPPLSGSKIIRGQSLHLSVGVGITWDSPFGPVRVDYAQPILYESFDKKQHIHFSFGAKF
ncbi:MAG: outer membrane protein assembly factor BamA [Alphaproteobacteria bacterium]|nr:outer membrane protein assembly factor BamA [Alphaproteobacteria bacterium]